jgi:oligopeptide transport system substrate-binding protein
MADIAGATEAADKGVDGVGVKAIDDKTLEVKLTRPVSYFAEMMSFEVFFPQNQKFVESCGEKYGTGVDYQVYNGPFTLKTWKMEDQSSMEKNPDYWDAANVKLNKINKKVVKDTGAEVSLYEDGQIDRAALTADYVDKYKDSKEFKTRESASTFMLQVNGGKGASK